VAAVRGAEPTTGEEAMRRNLLLRHPVPEYPYEARRLKLSGSGAFQLKFDYDTGLLREIHIVRSTGKRVLDDAAISALKLWRAEPRSLHSIRQPVTFWGP
jgi:TonB family protein